MIVKLKKLSNEAIIPEYETVGAAAMDIVPISLTYKPEIDTWEYHTGLSFEIPEGYAMLIFPRSSNRKTDAYLTNSVGIVDSDFRGEVLVCFKNRDINIKQPPYELNGKGIAQLMIIPYPKIIWEEVDTLSTTERGDGGFGSTDQK